MPAINTLNTEQDENGRSVERAKSWTVLSMAKLLWNARRLLWKFTLDAIVVSVLLAWILPVRYASSAKVLPPAERSPLSALAANNLNGPLGLASDLFGGETSGGMVVGVLHSRTVADTLVRRFRLQDEYGIPWLHYRLKEYEARQTLQDRTSILEDRKSGVITITVEDSSAMGAAALAGGYVQELDHLLADLNSSAAHRERVFLEDRLKSVKQELDEAAAKFSQFASNNAALDMSAEGKAMLEGASRLEGMIVSTQAELNGLTQIYAPNNVRVKSARARLEELQRQLKRIGGAAQDDIANNDSAIPNLRKLPLLGVTYSNLYRELVIKETIYETLTKQYELAKVEEAKEISTVRLLDAADVPQRKSSPHRTLIVLLGGFLGFLLGSAYVVAREIWTRTDASDERKVIIRTVAWSLRRGILRTY